MRADAIIGVDFDNTLVSYDELMQAIALKEGWLSLEAAGAGSGRGANKRQIRDQLRRLTDGETLWQRLQARAYGTEIAAAPLMDGVEEFLVACRQRGATVYVVSHKTASAAADLAGSNLRAAALAWMEEHGFFAPGRFGLSRSHVFFESTRREKVQRITALGCTHYIDDLEDTFSEPGFPGLTEKILYAPEGASRALAGVRVHRTWGEIHEHLFGARA